MSERILVLGGGMVGVCSAVHLGDAFGGEHLVTLVDERDEHVFYPNNLWVMTGARTRAQSTRRLSRLAQHGVDVVQDRVEGIDPKAATVQLAKAGPISYDRLVIGLGLQTHPDAIPGATDVNHPWELDAAERFRAELERFQGGRLVFGIAGLPYRCPPAPYETCWLLDSAFRRRGIRSRVQMSFFSPEPAAFGGGNKAVTGWAMNRMAQRGVEMHWGFQPVEVDRAKRVVRSKDGRELTFDLLGMVPVHRPAQPLLDSGVAGPGGVKVGLADLATEWPNVFAGGDCSTVPISKAGGQAHLHAEVISHNLIAELAGHDGRRDARRYKPHSI